MFKHVDVVVLTVDETPVRALLSSAAREREHLSNLRTPLKEAVTDTKNRQRILDPFPGKKKKVHSYSLANNCSSTELSGGPWWPIWDATELKSKTMAPSLKCRLCLSFYRNALNELLADSPCRDKGGRLWPLCLWSLLGSAEKRASFSPPFSCELSQWTSPRGLCQTDHSSMGPRCWWLEGK